MLTYLKGYWNIRKVLILCSFNTPAHYNDVIMSTMASQITSLTIVYSTVYSGVDQRKHQSSASLALVRGIHQWPVNSLHKGPVTRKMSVLMLSAWSVFRVDCALSLYHLRSYWVHVCFRCYRAHDELKWFQIITSWTRQFPENTALAPICWECLGVHIFMPAENEEVVW